jgi:hypothetical protein
MSGTVAHIMPANGGAGRNVALAEIQGTEGTAATLTAADAQALLAFAVTPAHTSVPRPHVAPEQPGSPPISTRAHATVTAQAEMIVRDVSAADGSDAPYFDWLLRCGGWGRVADAGSKSYTYVLQTAPSEVATVAQQQLNAGNTRYLTTQAQDVRGSVRISAQAGGLWLIDFAGLGVLSSPSSASDPRSATGSAWSGTLTYPAGAPMVLEGCTVRLYDPASATLYGGGSLASPGTAGDLLSFSLDSLRQVAPRVGASASSAIHGALPNVGGGTLEVVMEATADNALDILALRASGSPLYFFVRGTQRGTSNTVTLLCWFSPQDIDDTQIADALYTMTIRGPLLWTPDVSDNSPTAGSSPTQALASATNYGLPLAPSGLPRGLAVLQVATP